VRPGDHLPGIPQHRVKLGVDCEITRAWTVGAALSLASAAYYHGDEANQNAPLPGVHVARLHAAYRASRNLELFAAVQNLFNARYSTYGIYSDPTGVGAPGIPAGATTNGPGVDNRFQSPAAPIGAQAGVRVIF
jgi:iron complex outermembrane receptor protein